MSGHPSIDGDDGARSDSDASLVAMTLDGSPTAFASLVERHQKRLYNLAFRMLGNADEADDATQDAFLRAYRKLSTFRSDAAFSTWLYRIGVNTCYDALRLRARTPAPVETLEERGSSAHDPADTAGASVDVQRALAQVPQEFRAVLIMHDMHDLPFEDIAKTLGVPTGTVKSRLHRGRAMLGALLQGTPRGSSPSEGTP